MYRSFISFLKESSELCQGEKIKVLAQNVNDNLKGAFTGEVSIDMLKSINVDGVILGHSERREYYNEDDDLLLRKLKVSLKIILKFISVLEKAWRTERKIIILRK